MSAKPKKQTTEFVRMLIAANDIEDWWGRIAHLSSWILLQGYVIFPSTFTSYNLAGLETPPGDTTFLSKIKIEIAYLLKHVPQFGLALGAVILGGIGMFGCLMRWRRNYVWGLREVISPGFYAASTGLVSTGAHLLGAKGHLSAASKITLFVTGGATTIFAILWLMYKPILIRNAKKKHIDEAGYYVGLGQHGEGRLQAQESDSGLGTKAGNVSTGIGAYIGALLR